MNHLIIAHLQSSNGAAQSAVAQILHAQTGGVLLQAGSSEARSEPESNTDLTHFETEFEDMYCRMMASPRGGIIDVSPDHCQAMAEFIRLRRHVLTELQTIIVSTSPDIRSQEVAVEILNAIRAAGIDPSCIRIIFVDTPANTEIDDAYSIVLQYVREAQIPVSPEAALPASMPFSKALQFRLPIPAILNRAVDFETELTAARFNGAPEKVMHTLARKVIAQRDLLGATDTFQHVAKALGIPCITQEAWREDATPVVLQRKRPKNVAAQG
jgi:hypothetical protein